MRVLKRRLVWYFSDYSKSLLFFCVAMLQLVFLFFFFVFSFLYYIF